MNKRDFLKHILTSFFIVVTLVNIAMAVLGLLYDSNRRFGYEAFFSPIIFGVLGMLPTIVTYSKKELTMKQMLLREVLQLFLLETLLISFVFTNNVIDRFIIIPFAFTVFIIAVMVQFILWGLDCKKAKSLTIELRKYQNDFKGDFL